MGYYSDVVLTLPKETRRKFEDFLRSEDGKAARASDFDESYPRPWCGSVLRDGKKIVTYYVWQGVKWYNEFDEVKAILAFLDSLHPDEYFFQILGEDFGDYYRRGSFLPEEYFYVHWELARPKGVVPEDIPHQGYSSFEAWQVAVMLDNMREHHDFVRSLIPQAFDSVLDCQSFVRAVGEAQYSRCRDLKIDGHKIRREHVMEYVEGVFKEMKEELENA